MHSPLSRRALLSGSGVPAAEDRIHIASLLIQVVPHRLDAVREAVSRLPCAELHPTSHPGKFAVVLEAPHERQLADATEQLTAVSGVLTVSIVAHYVEERAALDEDVEP